MDYLQEKIDGVKANEFLMNAKVLDKNAAFTHLSKPFITSGNELNIDGEKTGYYVTNETEIVDLAASTTSKEFRDQLDAEYDRVFKSGSSVSQMQDYLYSIGIVDDITGDEWQNLSVAKRKQKINNALTEHLFEGRFAGLANPSEKVNQVAVVLKEGDEKSEQILAAAIEQGIQNPLNNNQPYKMGDTIYIKESQVRDKRLSDDKKGGNGTEEQIYFKKILDALSSEDFKINESLFTSITPTPGGKTFYKYFSGDNDGVYEVDADGVQQGDNPIPIPVLQSIYRTAIK